MKKLVLSLVLLAGTGMALMAQKTINDANAEKRSVGGFHGIDVGTGISLVLTKGATEEVAVSASKAEYRDKIITKVENGVLKIHYKSEVGSINRKKEDKDLKTYVSYKLLDKLIASTGAEVEIEGVLEAGSFSLTANTGALVNGKISIGKLKVKQDTGSKITLTGKADELEAEGDTGSKFMGEELSTVSCDINVSTGAKLWITADKELKVKASTGAMVKYKGTASIKEVKTNTGGSVSKSK